MLREEIRCLQTSLENHPDTKKLSFENTELRKENKKLKSLDPTNDNLKTEIAEKHRYVIIFKDKLMETKIKEDEIILLLQLYIEEFHFSFNGKIKQSTR